MARFLRRLWKVALEQATKAGEPTPDTPLARKAHATIVKVSDDIGRRFAMNTTRGACSVHPRKWSALQNATYEGSTSLVPR